MTIKTQTLSYTAGQDGLKGYIAYDDANESPGPGVMVIHEWWGLDDYIRTRADRLAELGYTALAIDMYGNGDTAGNPNEAGAMMNAVLGDMETGTSRLKAAHEVLCAQSMVDGEIGISRLLRDAGLIHPSAENRTQMPPVDGTFFVIDLQHTMCHE